jgi:hypothetical protein
VPVDPTLLILLCAISFVAGFATGRFGIPWVVDRDLYPGVRSPRRRGR